MLKAGFAVPKTKPVDANAEIAVEQLLPRSEFKAQSLEDEQSEQGQRVVPNAFRVHVLSARPLGATTSTLPRMSVGLSAAREKTFARKTLDLLVSAEAAGFKRDGKYSVSGTEFNGAQAIAWVGLGIAPRLRFPLGLSPLLIPFAQLQLTPGLAFASESEIGPRATHFNVLVVPEAGMQLLFSSNSKWSVEASALYTANPFFNDAFAGWGFGTGVQWIW